MNGVTDFEDMLAALNDHEVCYLIIGGLAFIFHAKPRYTKDMDLWVERSERNLSRANLALVEFGSPLLLDAEQSDQVLQIGVAPNRIDLILNVEGLDFNEAWQKRLVSPYGGVEANWIDLRSLLKIKGAINHPRHQEDARILQQVLDLQKDTTDREG